MPDFYADNEYDLSGFAVGIVKQDSVINGKDIVVGDDLIGLPSNGVHSNGFSLVRKVLARSGLSLKDKLPGEDVTLGEALMAPTVIYVKQALELINKGGIKGIAHITGKIEDAEMRWTFNMGIGMVLVMSQESSYRILEGGGDDCKAYYIGEVISGEGVSLQ
ncbi:hypothetical protein FH972_005835 [Carpinus fangiana]|uniref:phosphoribosylformylglycinamidine cyclo-ligase n=1 Tax=Carpinus fangiana TaxID=176857 RepID=A0A5N6QQG6_9ROSI|nr:hypothetical protein FH972_005835 [Carpinus fangiana]